MASAPATDRKDISDCDSGVSLRRCSSYVDSVTGAVFDGTSLDMAKYLKSDISVYAKFFCLDIGNTSIRNVCLRRCLKFIEKLIDA